MVVPSTPLHTTRVLTEDKEMWDDVKVSTTATLTYSGRAVALHLTRLILPTGGLTLALHLIRQILSTSGHTLALHLTAQYCQLLVLHWQYTSPAQYRQPELVDARFGDCEEIKV